MFMSHARLKDAPAVIDFNCLSILDLYESLSQKHLASVKATVAMYLSKICVVQGLTDATIQLNCYDVLIFEKSVSKNKIIWDVTYQGSNATVKLKIEELKL